MESKNNARETSAVSFAKIVRILTIAPIMALVLLCLLYWQQPDIFGGAGTFALAAVFLAVFPVLGYPLQPIIPGFKDKGREGQRNLAIVTAVLGYIGGIVHAAVASVSSGLWVIYLSYFLSGVGVMVFNKLLKIRASGHACGVAGPMTLLVYFFGAVALVALLMLALVFYTSLKIKRHTLSQLIVGSCIPVVAVLLGVWIAGLL